MNEQNVCELCGAKGPDKRGLRINCGYAVDEAVPEMRESAEGGYAMTLCKTCRGSLLEYMEAWADERRGHQDEPKDADGAPLQLDPERPVPLRRYGASIMVSRAEYMRLEPGRVPIELHAAGNEVGLEYRQGDPLLYGAAAPAYVNTQKLGQPVTEMRIPAQTGEEIALEVPCASCGEHTLVTIRVSDLRLRRDEVDDDIPLGLTVEAYDEEEGGE